MTNQQAAIERVKVAFWASLTNANAGMKWLDHDSMEEMISAAWIGFEEPIIAALSPDEEKVAGASLPTDDDDTVERVAKLIDPDAWHDKLRDDGLGLYWIDRRTKAKKKAQAIHTLIGRDR